MAIGAVTAGVHVKTVLALALVALQQVCSCLALVAFSQCWAVAVEAGVVTGDTDSIGSLVESISALARAVCLEIGIRSASGTAVVESVSTSRAAYITCVTAASECFLVVAWIALT